jgi:hypothetical protein
MKNRRTFLRVLASGLVALTLVAVPALADELLGVITNVDVDGKKLTVVEKGTDKEVIVTVNDDTEYVTPKKTGKVDLEKLSKNVERAKEKNRKGVAVKIDHDKAVASKITIEARKKGGNN